MIEKIEISNFKNIANLSLVLDNINVLVGSNNSGKSSILQAIQFAISVAQTTNFENTRWNNQTKKLPTSLTPEQLIYAPFRDVYSLAFGGKLKTELKSAIQIEFTEKDSSNATKVLIRKGKNKNIATEIHNKPLGELLRKIEEPFSIYVPGLAGIPSFEELKSPGIVRRAAARGDANNVFRNIIWLLNTNKKNWDLFIADIKDIFPEVEIIISFNAERDEHLNIYIKYDDKILPIDAAGTGFLQIIQILSYINIYKPKILLLDEPDAHLHPNNQRKLAKKLFELSIDREFQIIISTHSRHFLYELEPISKINWINSGKLVNEDISIINVLMDIGALDKGDLVKNGKIKLILLTEDENKTPIQTVVQSSNIPLDEIEIWSYKGCSDVKTANVLSAYILKNAPKVKIAIHRDRDYSEAHEIQEIVESYSSNIMYHYITEGTDIESQLLEPKHINFLYPEISIERAEEIINESIEDTFSKTRSKFVNSLSDKSLKSKNGHQAGYNVEFAEKSLKENPKRYCHGKTVLGSLKTKLQKEFKKNINLFKPSEFIKSSVFDGIRADLWN
ncbi:SMC domain protein (plasmid) [Emticicia oligotrophica DSM 17448]|uniref:SMC domain protein n=1 Tax=Emticicia oligotrophica (strain DSM 17448 / CIP 109782 / MTCC 6937 / GPTSA100-15) TaxID=929562 RepID=A0ABM5N7U6_EMTOG|nr:AAA family ATPase [Emticicia oligotrophica]AFK05487.1 SMC domain protein [Emticicia oligotrophica DSM 17448]